jgi:septum formation protein
MPAMTEMPEMPEMPALILASASPRREELLKQLGLAFAIHPGDVEEEAVQAASPRRLVERLAYLKARSVSLKEPRLPVLGADTVVVLQGKVLGKPLNPGHALRMLACLQGRAHQVYTGVALVHGQAGRAAVGSELTRVWMRPATLDELKAYVATGEPRDKAGSYGIQGRGGGLVSRIEGCYFNVVGLPLALTGRMLKEFGVRVF